ncbi:hypothetical protein [Azovibrio restrictus]|uniref:hypothetical protein n=1 Tax=Azovibrio restrictus TaxID=146938 RepID=UPI0026F358BC|nr:hypothetical protein [Azovibrio restrictus]MDD3484224.1 hypothetical protein [Azovibrio restrictus]
MTLEILSYLSGLLLLLWFSPLLLLAGLLLLLCLVLSNWQDEAPDPELVRLLQRQVIQPAQEQNGYFAWVGVMGPVDQEPLAWGKRWYLEARRLDAGEGSVAEHPLDKELRQETIGREQMPCASKPGRCLELTRKDMVQARTILEQGAQTLARGEVAMACRYYQEPRWAGMSVERFLYFKHPSQWSGLSGTRFALAVAEGRDGEGLAQLAREMDFYRRQLAGSATLISKMVALAWMERSYQFLNQYLRQFPEGAREHRELLVRMLAPLPEAAVDMHTVLETEFLMVHNSLLAQKLGQEIQLSKALSLGQLNLLYLPQATANGHFRQAQALLALEGRRGADYAHRVARLGQQNEVILEPDWFLPRNLVGRILLQVGQPNWSSYFLRRDDLLVWRQVVALQLDMLESGLGVAEVVDQALLEGHLAHPFNGRSPRWNLKSRHLVYEALPQRREGKALEIRL